ncbi:BRO family protein [Inediibacterium massiliense]|uniref:BRO family protein n=1 Tax=Inediibacterium massiliense TaxID=1658111 RepID=UPI0006B69578|nr:BRO family protein [Inediibacterium massiliense]
MHELKIFENEKFGQIRTLLIDGEPWFVGKDVAQILKYSNPQKAIRDHVDEDDRTVNETFTVNGTKGTLINESGLYSLILSSKLPTAKKFKRWVTSEVLPSIRAYGGYITKAKLDDIFHNPENLAVFLRQMLKVAEENERLKDEIDTLEPKADYFDTLVDNKLLVNFRTTAKELGIKPMRFTQFLLDKKFVFRDTKQVIHPMQPFVHSGLFEIKEFCRNGHSGTQTLITPKGRQYFMKLLIECEII